MARLDRATETTTLDPPAKLQDDKQGLTSCELKKSHLHHIQISLFTILATFFQ